MTLVSEAAAGATPHPCCACCAIEFGSGGCGDRGWTTSLCTGPCFRAADGPVWVESGAVWQVAGPLGCVESWGVHSKAVMQLFPVAAFLHAH